jgi:hypothetical protein
MELGSIRPRLTEVDGSILPNCELVEYHSCYGLLQFSRVSDGEKQISVYFLYESLSGHSNESVDSCLE